MSTGFSGDVVRGFATGLGMSAASLIAGVALLAVKKGYYVVVEHFVQVAVTQENVGFMQSRLKALEREVLSAKEKKDPYVGVQEQPVPNPFEKTFFSKAYIINMNGNGKEEKAEHE
jgi:hypothetical protein